MQRIIQRSLGSGNLQHFIIWKRRRFLLARLLQKTHTNTQQRRNLVQEYERQIEQLSEDQKLSKRCCYAGLKLVETGQYLKTLDTEEGQQMQHLSHKYTMPRNEKGTRIRGWILKNTRIGPVLNIKKFAIMMIDTVSKFKIHVCLKTIPPLGLKS